MQIKLRYLPILLASTMSVSGTATAQELTADGFVKGVVRVKLQPEVASRLSNAVLPKQGRCADNRYPTARPCRKASQSREYATHDSLFAQIRGAT